MKPNLVSSNLIVDELSYPLVRRYPFGRAFKWWVFAAFACFLGLLRVFNLAVNGFDKNIIYTMDPNTTMSTRHWYNNGFFTWGSNSLDPTCQSLQIPVGYRFITTNLGFQYTVFKVYLKGFRSHPRASASYLNNTLENCDINKITIDLKKTDNAKPDKRLKNFHRYRWADSSAKATAQCDFPTNDGIFSIEFTTEYDLHINDLSFVVAPDDLKSHPILWWGMRLLNTYFTGLLHIMCGYLPDDTTGPPLYTQAQITFHKRTVEQEPNRSIDNVNMYRLDYRFHKNAGALLQHNFGEEDSRWAYNNKSYELSRPFTEAFMWSKVWRSLILADLGNTEAENLLTNETLLRSALNPTDDFNRKPGAILDPDDNKGFDKWMLSAFPVPKQPRIPMRDAWERYRNETGPMAIAKATIPAEYICSVPSQRSPVAMALYTLAANLAVFHTAWSLFKFVADRRALQKDTYSNWCVGCITMHVGASPDSTEIDVQSQLRPSSEMVERRQSIAHDGLPSRNSSLEERRSTAGNDASDALLTSGIPGPNFNTAPRPIPP